MSPKIAIVIYSMYGHSVGGLSNRFEGSAEYLTEVAEAEKAGVEAAGGTATIFQIPETLPQDVLTKMSAPPKPNYPIITPDDLAEYDAFIFGIPTRYGNFPAQWKAFWDSTGKLWAAGSLAGKYAGVFVSSGAPGDGQESTVIALLSTFVHHGIIYVPIGYLHALPIFSNVDEVRGGSPWGAGTFAGPTGERNPAPSAMELKLATIQGKAFYGVVDKVSF